MLDKQSIKALNQIGYNPVAFPYRDYEPLDVLYKKKKNLTRLGSISRIITDATETKPEVDKDIETPNISGKLTSDFDFNLGISALNELLAALGASGAGLEVEYKKAKGLKFEYNNILRDSLEPFAIADYLGNAVPDVNHALIDDLDQEKEAYIVREILKSNSFSTTTTDETGIGVDINVANIQGILDVHPGIQVTKTKEFTISYEGDKYFHFAVMVMMIWISRKDKTFMIKIPTKPPGASVKSLTFQSVQLLEEQGFFSPPVIQPGELLSIVD